MVKDIFAQKSRFLTPSHKQVLHVNAFLDKDSPDLFHKCIIIGIAVLFYALSFHLYDNTPPMMHSWTGENSRFQTSFKKF